jgi:hypothetical protein
VFGVQGVTDGLLFNRVVPFSFFGPYVLCPASSYLCESVIGQLAMGGFLNWTSQRD